MEEKGWIFKEDAGRGWRRVVPSPIPLDAVEKDTIKDLRPKNCIVNFGWGSGKDIVFNLVYEKNGQGNPYDEFINGIKEKAEAYYFIMGLDPPVFHFNPRYAVSDEKYSMLMFKLKRNEQR